MIYQQKITKMKKKNSSSPSVRKNIDEVKRFKWSRLMIGDNKAVLKYLKSKRLKVVMVWKILLPSEVIIYVWIERGCWLDINTTYPCKDAKN